MHIEPGVVEGGKIMLSYGTAAIALGVGAKFTIDSIRTNGLIALLVKSIFTTLLVLVFFEVLPHFPVGVSEVHFILGTTLFLLFGTAPAAIGLVCGLLMQGILFAPSDLPQFGMNITTLLAPLFAVGYLAQRVIPEQVPYKDIAYAQTLKLSVAYQAGIVGWVAFWALYGHGFGSENLTAVASFGGAYLTVIILEPLVDLAVLAGAKALYSLKDSVFVETRLFNPATRS